MKQSTLLVINTATSVIRLLAVLLTGLLTTPMLLRQLGPDGFGLLMTVGASGVLFAVVTDSLQLSVARELAFCLGTGQRDALSEAFASALALQGAAGLDVTGLGCLLAPWWVEWLTIPEGQHRAVFWCLVLVFIKLGGGIVVSAYNGLIVAHQDLRLNSGFNLLARLTNLMAALTLYLLPWNKLLTFVAVGFLLTVLLWVAIVAVCLHRYAEAKPRISKVRLGRLRQMLSYGSLAFLGGISSHLRMQGAALYYNIVFGNLVAAAHGVALRLGGLVGQFLGVLLPVIQPALTTRTGAGDQQAARRLVTLTSGLCLALSLTVAVPILVDAEWLLTAWLGAYPDLTPLFVRCFCLSILLGQLSAGQKLAVHARGDIGGLVMGNQFFLLLPVVTAAVVAWSTHSRPWMIPVAEVLGTIAAAGFFQPLWAGPKLRITYLDWLRETVLPFLGTAVVVGALSSGVRAWVDEGGARLFILLVSSGVPSISFCWLTVFNEREKRILKALAVDALRRGG